MKFFAILAFVMISSLAFGQSSKTISYDGQNSDSLSLVKEVFNTTYTQEPYQGQCQKQVPYTTNVCGTETFYKQQCHYVPGYQKCGPQQCHHVTKYKVVCRYVNGRKVCTNEPYQDYVCSPGHCYWTAGHDECHSVPYSQYICKDVVQYKTEVYECTKYNQVPHKELVKTFKADVDVNYINNLEFNKNVAIMFTLNEQGQIEVQSADGSVLIAGKKQISSTQSDKEVNLDAKFDLQLLPYNKFLSPVRQGIEEVKFNRKALRFDIGRVYFPEQLRITLSISRNGGVKINRPLEKNEYQLLTKDENTTQVAVDLKALGLNLKWANHDLRITVDVLPSMSIMNENVKLSTEIFKTDFAQ